MNSETPASNARRRRGRRIPALATATALATAYLLTAGAASAPAAAAHAGSPHLQPGVLQCLGTESDTYSPGVVLAAPVHDHDHRPVHLVPR